MNFRCPFAVLLVTVFFLFPTRYSAQQNVIDSLNQIPMTNRDTAWVDQALRASFGVVYNDPSLSETFLRTISQTAEVKGYDNRKSRIRLNQGIAKDIKNQPDSALYYYNLGLAIAKDRKDTAMMASAYNNIGLIHWNSDRLDSALVFYRLSEEMFDSVGNERGLTSTLNNMGLIYQSLERLDKSLVYFRRVKTLAEKNELDYFKAVAYQNMSVSHAFNDNNDSSYFFVQKAIPMQKANDDLWGLAKSYHTLATALDFLDSLDRAEEEFLRAIEINKKLDNSHALASNYYSLADVHRRKQNAEMEFVFLEKANDLEGTYSDGDLRNKVSTSYNLGLVENWNETIGRELKRSFVGKDSLYRTRLEGEVLKLQEEYEAEKRQQELTIKDLQLADQEEEAQQRERLILGLALLLVVLILFGVLFVRYRSKLSKLKTQQRLAAERSRISRDLHDNIGAQLTAMSTRIDLLDNGGNHVGELEQIRDEAADTVSMLRDTIWAMHREEFTVPQFMSRIRQYANRVLPPSIKLDLHYDKKLEKEHLNSSEALNLFRIAQEAIQNCMKHSDASTIRIQLLRKKEQFEFLVSDNGKGCILVDETSEDSYGLQNIRERSAEIKGHAEFESETGNGFTIRVAF